MASRTIFYKATGKIRDYSNCSGSRVYNWSKWIYEKYDSHHFEDVTHDGFLGWLKNGDRKADDLVQP